MRFWPFHRSEERAGYTDAIVDYLVASASTLPVDVAQVAAAEYGAGIVGAGLCLGAA